MPEPKRPLKVFLCHASTDKPKVRELYRYLKRRGINPWFDEEHLVGGQDWQVEIPKALATSDAIIICLTKNSVDKEGYIQKEIRFALDKALEMPEGRIFLIPVKFEECEVPFTLSRYQWVDLTVEAGYAKMMKALKFRASQLERSTVGISKKDVEEENFAREKKEYESNEHAERKLKEKEPPERQSREIIEKPRQKPTVRKLFSNTVLLFWGVFVFGAIALIWKPFFQIIAPTTIEKKPKVVTTSTYTETVEIHPTSTVEPTITPTPLPTEITDAKGITMRLVPAGEFEMGSENGDSNEQPVHQVYLDAFYMDIYEVTNTSYRSCLMEGICTLPEKTSSFTRLDYFENSQYDNYPVVNINWNQANTYCEWRGGSLPTEAEWEKSARGTDERIYPWGNNFDHTRVNFCDKNCSLDWADKDSDDGYEDTAPVGSYESGKSPYGIYDLAGNVSEWVNDWYDEAYYQISPYANPLGPDVGQETFSGPIRAQRGGSWTSVDDTLTVFSRNWYYPGFFGVYDDFGFRCVKRGIQ